jgi:hypothetical protein
LKKTKEEKKSSSAVKKSAAPAPAVLSATPVSLAVAGTRYEAEAGGDARII